MMCRLLPAQQCKLHCCDGNIACGKRRRPACTAGGRPQPAIAVSGRAERQGVAPARWRARTERAVAPTWPELNRPSRCAPPRELAAVNSSLEQPDSAGAAPVPTRTARASPLQSPSKRGATKTLPKKGKSPAKSVKAAAVSECEERRAPPLPPSRRRLLQPAADACAAAHCMVFGC